MPHRRRASFYGVVGGLILTSVSAYGEPVTGAAFHVGVWDGNAFADAAGNLTHCAAIASQPKSTLLLLAESPVGEVYVGFLRPLWHFPQDQEYPVRLSIDGQAWGVLSAQSVDNNTLRVGPLTPAQILAIRYGETLTVTRGTETLHLLLKDSPLALEALKQCVAQASRAGPAGKSTAAPAAARASAGSSASAAGTSATLSTHDTAELRKLLEPVLSAAGIASPTFVSGASLGYEQATVGWQTSGLEGALYIRDGDLSDTVAQLRKNMIENCTGSFLASEPVTEAAGTHQVRSSEFVCGSGPAMSTIAVVEVLDPSQVGNLIFIHSAQGQAPATQLVSLNQNLRRVLVRLNKPDA